MDAIPAAALAKLAELYGDTITSGDLYSYDKKMYGAAIRGALPKIRRGVFSLKAAASVKPVDPKAAERARAEMASDISRRFSAVETLADGLIGGHIRSLIVAGAPGVGKTFTLENRLKAAEKAKTIKSVIEIKGTISGIGLFLTLWENREKGCVIMLDDIDSVFGDEEAMNVLKGALDSGSRRVISWMKDSSFLRDRDVPTTFEYEGQIVFVTNKNLTAEIEAGTKQAPHMAALLSRSVFLDLAIHSKEAILVRIEQVVSGTKFGRDLGLKDSQVAEVMSWLTTNVDRVRLLSLRTIIQIAGYIKTTPDWRNLAELTVLTQRH